MPVSRYFCRRWRRHRRGVAVRAAAGLAVAAAALLILFAVAMGINIRRGRRHIDCGCFQSALKQTLSWILVARNAGLACCCGVAVPTARRRLSSWVATDALLTGTVLFVLLQSMNILWSVVPAWRRPRAEHWSRKMTTMISLWLLWGVVIILALTVLALARQVGVLHERVAPAGALINGAGPGVGEESPRLEVHALAGNAITIGGTLAAGRALLMLFVSHTCPICKKLIPIAQDFARASGWTCCSSEMATPRTAQLIAQFGWTSNAFVNGPEIGMAYRVDKLPYAVLLDEAGMIAAKGLGQQPRAFREPDHRQGDRLRHHAVLSEGSTGAAAKSYEDTRVEITLR